MVMNKRNVSRLGYLLLACLVMSLNLARAETLDRIAAVVNSDVVLMSEVQQRMRVLQSSRKDKVADATLLKDAVDELILERLQTQYAEERGVRVDDATLNRVLETIAANNKMNLTTFQAALQRQGIDFIAFRESTRRKLLIDALRKQQIARQVNISDREIADLVATQSGKLTAGERYHLQHILVSAPNGTPIQQVNAARHRAEELRRRVAGGQDFSQIARQFSDNNAAQQGGDLGWQTAEKLPVSFVRVLALMKTGEISEVVRDANGFHILKLLDRQGSKRRGMVTEALVRHILISTENRTTTEAQQRINKIYQQIQAGADFGELASQYSDDPGSRAKGGSLGWVKPGKMVKQFAATMQHQTPGTLSQPFQTRYGWHVLEVMDTRQTDQTEEQLRIKAANFLGERKEGEQYRAWLQSLRNGAYIEYRIPNTGKQLQLN
ncbi:MAG: molecular chaperone SurA [Proteobacteria bacterium]|nr:MAG: molecular chaperone SurA [Pseudomonadota bacterium]